MVVTTTANVTGNINGTGAVFSGNVTADTFIGNISGNIDAGGANTNIQFNDGDVLAGSAAFTFDKVSNAVVASGNITGGNLLTGGVATVTGNITGGNLITAGLGSFGTTVTATGNITGGNLITAGLASVTGNITGGNVTTTGKANIGTLEVTGTGTVTGNITGGNLITAGQVVATGNVNGGNVVATALVTGANVTASANVTGANVVGTTSGKFGNIVISGDDITDTNGRVNFNTAGDDVDFAVNGDTVANVFYVDAGTGTASFGNATQTTNAIVAFNATNSILMPVGNTAQRPGTGVLGMLRYNSTLDALEQYTSTGWDEVGGTAFTIITNDEFNGDGSTVAFTLSESATTDSCIVSINGVVQIPTAAYSVSSTTLTFTEAPLSGDVIDVRILTTTTTVTSIQNTSGNAVVETLDTANTVQITGSLLPAGNATQSLGSSTKAWKDLYVAGNTIYLGGLQLKEASANTFAVYTSDGTTQANIDAGSIDVSSISSGTSAIGISGTNGNAYITVGGTANVLVVATTGANVTGTLGVSGVISGNASGLTAIPGANVTGTVATATTAGTVTTAAQPNITSVGTLSSLAVTGNITAGNLSGTSIVGTLTTASQTNITSVGTLGSLTVTANVAGGNITTAGQVVATGNVTGGGITLSGNTISSTGSTLTIDPSAAGATGTVIIAGNLSVQGTTTTYDSTTVTINDLLFSVANNAATAAAANGGGLEVGPAGSAYAQWTYDQPGGRWSTALGINATGNISGGNLSGTSISGTLATAAQTNITSVGTLSSLAVTGNITSGNLSGTSIVGTLTTAAQTNITSVGALNGGSITSGFGAIDIGTDTVTCGGIINSNANGVGNIGSSTTYFNTVFAKATSAQYADLAEKYVADAEYVPGTVVVFGGDKEVTVSSTDADRAVAGVVSTNPSYIMNGTLEAEFVATVALTGRVPCRVTGTVRKGDLMVSAGYGLARAEQDPKVGTVIGKALENFEGNEGVIEVVVGRF